MSPRINIRKGGQPQPPLTALKLKLTAEHELREELHLALQSLSSADWLALVKDKTGVKLSGPPKVTLMKQWFAEWDATEALNDAVNQEWERLRGADLTDASRRSLLLTKVAALANASGDSDTVLKAVDRAQSEADLARKERELAVKQEALAQAERKLVLLEAKAAQANATEQTLDDATLTAEQREQRIKEIYGRA